MREYLPLLIAGAIIGVFSILFFVAYCILKKQKEDMTDRERHMSDREIIRRLLGYARPYIKEFIVVLVVMLLFSAIPQDAHAESFWGMLQRIGDAAMEYLSLDERYLVAEDNYVFATDHPGLQRVYDAVVELGIKEPVVPMWIPEEYHLEKISITETPMMTGVCVSFWDNQHELVYQLSSYIGEPAHQFYKDDTNYEIWELNGIDYHVARNNEWWIVVWERENTECFLALDCQEEDLWRILDSIYATED